MNDLKCVFSHGLASGDFGCTLAEPVIRRGGQEFNCRDQGAHRHCDELFGYFKDAALPEFGYQDDLLSMPHSVPVKIQCGGLLQLGNMIEAGTGPEKAADIAALLDSAREKFGDLSRVPCAELVDAMKNYKVSRRRTRK